MSFNSPEEFIFLSTQTASASGSLSFTSLITSTYPVYYVKIRNLLPATNATTLNLTFSTNNGSSYLASNYQYSKYSIYEAGTVTGSNNSTTAIQLVTSCSNTSARTINGEIYFYGLAQSVVATCLLEATAEDSNAHIVTTIAIGANTGTTAINAIKFAMSSGNITSGTISLYGMKI